MINLEFPGLPGQTSHTVYYIFSEFPAFSNKKELRDFFQAVFRITPFSVNSSHVITDLSKRKLDCLPTIIFFMCFCCLFQV